MKNNNPYEIFPNFVLRSPLLPLSFYKTLTESSAVSNDTLMEICRKPIIRESLFLASPSLFEKMNKWLDGKVEVEKEVTKLKYALLKYIARMSSRCTPFGIFAGCAVGKFSDETKIHLMNAKSFARHTRLDMNFLVSLSQNLAKRPDIKSQLMFYPNSSLYKVGHQLRYVEYQYIQNRRHHQIASVSNSEYLDRILKQAKEGCSLDKLSNLIIEDEISFEEASHFINQLVENQLLISELEPSVSGPEFLTQIIDVLSNLEGLDTLINTLLQIKKSFNELDQNIGNDIRLYEDIKSHIKTLDTEFDDKYLFQTDLSLKTEQNQLDKKVAFSIRRSLTFLAKLSAKRNKGMLDQFRDAFSKRYESREMPLSKVLDLEIGIGFQQNQGSDDPDPILDNLFLPSPKNNNPEQEYKLNSVQRILTDKILDAINSNDSIIDLKDQDFDFMDTSWNDTPDTLSIMIELLNKGDNEKVRIIPFGGSSAANLLGRFCHGDQELLAHTQSIVDIEEKINSDKILAEIVHLPESRVGNVLMRPGFRKAEIPYLAKSVLSSDQQISIEDLMISVRGNRIILRSKKHNKEVLPRLSNAHNFITNALPIYQFLACMQTQNQRSSLSLEIGSFAEGLPYVPRIEYQNVILRSACWNITKADIEELLEAENNEANLKDEIPIFCKKRKLPDFVLLKDGDNELLINFKSLTSVKMLLSLVKKRQSFKLDEFLFDKKEFVSENSENSSHSNQIIISFYHKERLQQKTQKHENAKNLYHW